MSVVCPFPHWKNIKRAWFAFFHAGKDLTFSIWVECRENIFLNSKISIMKMIKVKIQQLSREEFFEFFEDLIKDVKAFK